MTERQRWIIIVGSGLLALNALFPPSERLDGFPQGRGFLLSPSFSVQRVDGSRVELYRLNLAELTATSLVLVGATVAAALVVGRPQGVEHV